METIGIITIHKIYNYGSIFQAYALQKVCEEIGYDVEIIDYTFPNMFHRDNKYSTDVDKQRQEPLFIKLLYAFAILKQHRGMNAFIKKYYNLSSCCYNHPNELIENVPKYNIYITGSDQVWNPRHTKGDPAYMLHFAPDYSLKIAYAASSTARIPNDLKEEMKRLLLRYNKIGVREESGSEAIYQLLGERPDVVLDPTLLLNKDNWNKLAYPERLIKKKYILCYFLNYSFNAFPYVDELAEYMQKQTGYKIIHVGRPPHNLKLINSEYRVGASPEEFLALVRDAEIVLTTSFHGTAFALNFGRPLLSIVEEKMALDSRQINLMNNMGLIENVISIKDKYPSCQCSYYDVVKVQDRLEEMRQKSLTWIKNALNNEGN